VRQHHRSKRTRSNIGSQSIKLTSKRQLIRNIVPDRRNRWNKRSAGKQWREGIAMLLL
jgi:hypothetical protein